MGFEGWPDTGKVASTTVSYQGPASIHTLLLTEARKRGISAVCLWGHAPHYIEAANTRLSYAIVDRLRQILGITVNLDDLKQAAVYMENQMDKALGSKTELRDYVTRLEEEYYQGRYHTVEPLAADIIQEVKDFLRGYEEE